MSELVFTPYCPLWEDEMRKQIRKKAGTKSSMTKIDIGTEYLIRSYQTEMIQATHQDGKNNTKKSLDLISKVVKLDNESR